MVLLWAASSPAAQPSVALTPFLKTQCVLHAADPKNPWALAHGITGMGASFSASDGTLASDLIVSRYLLKSSGKERGMYGFAAYGPDGTPIEPHPNLLTKTLVLAGVPMKRTWTTPHGEVSLGDLVESAQKSFRHAPGAPAYWNDVGWTLDLFTRVMTPKKAKFVDGSGATQDLNGIMDDALSALELLNADLSAGMAKDIPSVPKRKTGIYAHSCGGLHLVQAVFSWARFPEVRKRWGKRLDHQIAVLFYRLDSEQPQYEAALAQAPSRYTLQILVQQLKFYGHFLETVGRLKQDKVVHFSEARKVKINHARALLDATVNDLQSRGVYEAFDSVRASQPQVALDLIGDACHAVNGLSLTAKK